MLKYMKPTHPTVMGQIKFLLEVNPPRVRPNPATFTQVTAAQLREVRVPVVTPLQTQAMSSSINVLAKAYGLSVPQVSSLCGGRGERWRVGRVSWLWELYIQSAVCLFVVVCFGSGFLMVVAVLLLVVLLVCL